MTFSSKTLRGSDTRPTGKIPTVATLPGQDKLRKSFPITVILTERGEVFVQAQVTVKHFPVPTVLFLKLYGPMIPDDHSQLRELPLKPSQSFGEIGIAAERISRLNRVFTASVDLHEFRENYGAAIAAIKAKDVTTLREICPSA
ncbi:hypothetical protein KKB44_06305 [Candidatus Micrarchaeota archaeon]|nr:hypothetical protein [Candidatus Micrarchaeota archaeon]